MKRKITSLLFLCICVFAKFLIVMMAIVCWSCQSELEYDKDSVFGKWEIMNFAYSEKGQKISNETLIPNEEKSCMSVSQIDTIFEFEKKYEFNTIVINWLWGNYYYSIDGNSIKYLEMSYPAYIYALLRYTDTGKNIEHALTNTKSYAIQGNELIIYFTGLNDKNLLILKRMQQ